MRRVAFVMWALALLALALPAHAGWSQSGNGQSGTGGITLPAGDLSGTGSSNSSPTISNLTGSGTTVTVQAPNVNWTQAVSTPTVGQAQQANGSNPQNMQFAPQAPGAGAASTATGTPGDFVVNVAAPVSTGTESGFVLERANTAFGSWIDVAGSSSRIFFGGIGGVSVSTSNYSLSGDGSNLTKVNGPVSGTLNLRVGDSGVFTFNASGGQFFSAGETFSLGGGTGVLGLTNATAVPTSNPTGGGIAYETAGAEWHRGSGGAVQQVAAAGSGTVNTQTMKLAQELYAARTTNSSGVVAATIAIPTTTCVQIVDTWSARGTAATTMAGTSTLCTACNAAGTVTVVAAANIATLQTIGSLCSTSAAAVTCVVSTTNINVTDTCNGGGTVDWQNWIETNIN